MADDSPIRIALVDDQTLVRVGFRMVLEAEHDFRIVAEAADGESAVQIAGEHTPDVMLVDVRMPGMNGIDATRLITEKFPAIRIIVLTTFDRDEYAFAALRAGASGFLLKDVRPSELAAAIRSVAVGDASVSSRITRQLLELFSSRLPQDRAADALPPATSQGGDSLTGREHEVLVAIAEGLTNAEIAQKLTVSESTVKTHVGRILHKLGLRDRVQAVIFAYDTGLVSPGN